jgi:threonine efflux protein
MQHLSSLLALAAVWSLVVVSPGPCFIAVIQHASSRSRSTGVYVALGIAAGTLVWCAGSLLGLSVIFAKFVWLYNIVRLAGAGYLVYLGIRTLLAAKRSGLPLIMSNESITRKTAWRVGFVTDISNAKAAAFFSSLFAALLPPAAPFGLIAASVVLVVAIEFGWYWLAASFFSLQPVVLAYRRMKRWVDYVTGAIFIGLGIRLAVSRSK